MPYTNEHQIDAWQLDVEAHQQPLMRDHALAMICFDTEGLIQTGEDLHRRLKEQESRWRRLVFRGGTQFDADSEAKFQRAYQRWIDTADKVISRLILPLEALGYEVEGSEGIKATVPRVREILSKWESPRLATGVGIRNYAATDADVEAIERLERNKEHRPYKPQKRTPAN